LVEHAERTGPEVEDREEQREPRERSLAAGHQRDGLQPLAARLCHQLDAGVERIAVLLGFDEPELRAATLEEPPEDLAEVPVDLLERLREPLVRRPRHASQRL